MPPLLPLQGMEDHGLTGGMGRVGAFVICATACASSDAPPSRDASKLDVAAVVCLEPWQRDTGSPAPFEVKGCQHTSAQGRAMAIFAWVNHTGQVQAVPYGPTNRIEPGPEAQGQPSTFVIGSGSFAVAFDGASATWALLGRSTTVTRTSPDCGQACGYAQTMGPNRDWIDTRHRGKPGEARRRDLSYQPDWPCLRYDGADRKWRLKVLRTDIPPCASRPIPDSPADPNQQVQEDEC